MLDAEYHVCPNKSDYSAKLAESITTEAANGPVVVFLDTKKAIKSLKEVASACEIPFYPVTTDVEMSNTLAIVRDKEDGIFATLARYGRGVDVRFKKDSVVIVGYLPERMETLRQMAGRSSRTMGKHRVKLVC